MKCLFCGLLQVNSYQNTKTRESLTLDYVACLMHTANQFKDQVFPGAKCAKDLQLPNWHVIEECANTTEGSKLLQDYGERTYQLKPSLTEVPTITFNHVSSLNGLKQLKPLPFTSFADFNFLGNFQQTDKDLNDFGLRDLRSAACRVMRDPKPHECSNYNSAVSNAATFTVVSICVVALAFAKLF